MRTVSQSVVVLPFPFPSIPSWAVQSPTTQAAEAKASKVRHRRAAMAAKVGSSSSRGQGRLTHCIEPKAEKANKSADPPARKSADDRPTDRRTSCAIFLPDELNWRHRRCDGRTSEGRPRFHRARAHAAAAAAAAGIPKGRWAAAPCFRGFEPQCSRPIRLLASLEERNTRKMPSRTTLSLVRVSRYCSAARDRMRQ